MFGDVATDFEFERHSATIEFESPAAFLDYFIDRFGPLMTARAMLGERVGELRAQILAICERRNEAHDGTLRLPQEYLQLVVRM